MGTEKRKQEGETGDMKNRPGPGAYAIKSYVGEGPKIHIKQRTKDDKLSTSLNPGPGAYQPSYKAIIEGSPSVGLGHGTRDGPLNKSVIAVPGPGAYYNTNDKKEGPKFGFGTSKRGDKKTDNVPGPGNYPIASTIGDSALPAFDRSKHI